MKLKEIYTEYKAGGTMHIQRRQTASTTEYTQFYKLPPDQTVFFFDNVNSKKFGNS